ncbi:hypothetical protein [Coleofasciculus sp.]|uniref:hypothetical protein n=1 Tax=Coleofasciculus sp. TaxID=3100458 RepID=UPI0039FB7991
MDTLRVEYLVSIEKQGAFCENIEALKHLLKANSEFSVENNEIKYREIIVYYDIQVRELKNERFFHLRFNYNWENKLEDHLNDYSQFLKSIRTVFHALPIQLNCLWDDISAYYSLQAYPLIHEIENLMRKLLTKFMITNVGVNWEKETLPKEIKSVIETTKAIARKESNNFLYEVDFIHLSDFLFKPYHNQPIDELYHKIKKAKRPEDLSIDELNNFIPKSNWQRYFSDLVEYEDSQLQKKWEELYQLRCKVAHNNTITRDEFIKIESLVSELKEKLQTAVDKLDEIEISEEEKKQLRKMSLLTIKF